MAPGSAAENTARPLPSTKATSTIVQNGTRRARMAAAREAIATRRTASAPIISHLRLAWSASTPAGTANSAEGRIPANSTSPALAADPVTASTSSG